MAALSLEIAELLALRAEVSWPEAIALVKSVGAARSHDVLACRLLSDGTVAAPGTRPEPATAVTVAPLADLLQRLLPPPTVSTEPRVPAALRYTTLRALGGITAPAFVSVEQFCESLSRFERGDRRQLLKALFARAVAKSDGTVARAPWPRAADNRPGAADNPPRAGGNPPPAADNPPKAADNPPKGRSHGERAHVIATRAPEWDSCLLNERRWQDPAGELLVHPDAVSPAWEAASSSGSSGLAEERPKPAPRHPRAGAFLTTLVALSLLLAAAVVTVAIVLTVDPGHHDALLDMIRPHLEWLREAGGM